MDQNNSSNADLLESLEDNSSAIEGLQQNKSHSEQLYSGERGDIFTAEEFLGEGHPALGDLSNIASSSNSRAWPVVRPGKSIGVTFRKPKHEEMPGTWEAHIWLKNVNIERANRHKNGSQHFLGSYRTQEEAKRVHDLAAIIWDTRVSKSGTMYSLNYPAEKYAEFLAEHPRMTGDQMVRFMQRSIGKFSKGACPLKGVTRKTTKKSGAPVFTATISRTRGLLKKTTVTLGHFQTEEEAGREYDRALMFLKGPDCIPNFPAASYSQAEVDETGRKITARHPELNNYKEKR